MKSINEYFDYLYSLERLGIKYDLNNITALLRSLGNPHKDLKFIHIAGTNGKGATASFAASILMEHGLKTGLFTSPHILKFNERIRVNCKCISDSYIKKFLNNNARLIRKIKPSFFEVNTALAFKYFYDKKVDTAVIEAGLGGRLDSTNIINPVVSVITQIGMDHMQYLGKTLRKIALEKIGIVKNNVPVVVSDNHKELKKLFKTKVRHENLYFIDDFIKINTESKTLKGTSFNIKLSNDTSITLSTPLHGAYQLRNAAAAIAAVKLFTNNSVSNSDIKKGISRVINNTGYFGRLHSIKTDNHKYIFDISHNPDGIKSALDNLKNSKINTVIFAMMADKDYKSSLDVLLKQFKYIIFTKPEYKRALDPDLMISYSSKQKLSLSQTVFKTDNVNEALVLAERIENKNGSILIIGSFFLVSEAVKRLNLQNHFH